MTSSGFMHLKRPSPADPYREIEVYVELEWSWEPGVSGSIAIARGVYCDAVTAWFDGDKIELTEDEKQLAMMLHPCGR